MNTRYIRNVQLPGFGEKGQRRLAESSVFIIGAGALGSVVAMYLAASGVGRIAVADFDNVDISNLQRQVFYSENELGLSKAEILCSKIAALNSEVEATPVRQLFSEKASSLIDGFDIVAECSDNYETKSLAVKLGRMKGIPVVLGGVGEYIGQVIVFPPSGPCYDELFGAGACSAILPCGSGGVFAPLAGVVGSMQAGEILKILSGLNTNVQSSMTVFNIRDLTLRTFSF